VIPTIDINTPKQQPFALVSGINPMPDNPKAPTFGENAILTSGDGYVIRIGDKIIISI